MDKTPIDAQYGCVVTVRVVALSDTHQQHWKLPELPPGDVLIHAGDFTITGRYEEIVDFNSWLLEQKHAYKIVVPGNHDIMFERSWDEAVSLLSAADFVLKDSACEILGKRFFGSPYTPEFHGWAFGYGAREGEVRWSQIPEGLDLLITHGPPHLIFDECPDKEMKRMKNVGCPGLRREVLEQAKPRFHVFGHVHEQYGWTKHGDVTLMNVSQLDGQYQLNQRRPMLVGL